MIFLNDPDLETLAWQAERVGEAMTILARKAGLLSKSLDAPILPKNLAQADNQLLGRWLDIAAGQLELEVDALEASYGEVLDMVRGAAPALLRLPSSGDFLLLEKGGRSRISIVAPDLSVRRIRPELVRDALTHDLEAPLLAPVDLLLAEAGVREERQARARRAILDEQLNSVKIDGCWLLRLSPSANFWHQIRITDLPRQMLLMMGGHVIQQILSVVGGWMILWGAFQEHFDYAWLLAWSLILLTGIPLRLYMLNFQSQLMIGISVIFKQRLLYGTLQLKPEEIRHQGIGQFLGRIMESEAVESLALGGGFAAVIAVVELFTAASVLTFGTLGWFHPLLLLLWTIVTLLMGWRYFRYSQEWLQSYREMTNDLVERMVGHRTRLAQEHVSNWHDEEDQLLARYISLSERLDRIGLHLGAFVNRGWLLLGLAGMAGTFIFTPTSSIQLGIILGGIMLASQALNSVVSGISSVVGILNAWEQFGPLFQAATRPKEEKFLATILLSERKHSDKEEALLEARDLVFRYRNVDNPVLAGCNLQIQKGDRVLLEGPSGGGKSTLAALLTGLRTADSGLLLLQGFDQQTIGTDEWRRRVVSAPQFHENHVLTETFAFNLLMGHRWPPEPEDLAEAEQVCRELGLGDLLDRMPAGMQQMVGESGWQLSHGERSRLYIARALLQKAALIILDESFAALDPENLYRALNCVLRRAPTLLVIAHP